MKVISKIQHEYAQVAHVKGDEYECEEEHVELVTRLGWADIVDAATEPRRKYQKRAA